MIADGTQQANKHELQTFRDTLGLLKEKGLDVPGLDRALATLDEYISFL